MGDRITKRAVDALTAPEDGETTLWDGELKGFGVRVRHGGAKTYILVYRAGPGRSAPKRRLTIGKHGSPWTPDSARVEAKRLLGLVADGADPASDKTAAREAPTVSDLVTRFLAEHADAKRKPRTAALYRDVLTRLVVPEMGTKKAHAVTTNDVARIHRRMKATPYQANNVLVVLSKMFALAEAWKIRPSGSNPCRHVERYRGKARERMLSAEEFGRLGVALADAERLAAQAADVDARLAEVRDEMARTRKTRALLAQAAALRDERKELGDVVSPYAVAAVRLLIFTGARMSEVLGLRWEWIDFERGTARLPDSKTGAKTLHLPPPALAVLAELPRIADNPHVIVGGVAGAALVNLEKPWRVIRTAARLEDVRLHDLRHGFASVAASSGLGLPIIGKMLGHTQAATTARYAHLAADPVAAAAATVAGKIADAMNSATAGGSNVIPLRGTGESGGGH